jgi:quinohemoprotein ethanol dehydrogenase
MIGPEPLAGSPGVLEAWDPVKHNIAWRVPGGGGIGGGTVSTAGNLVFQVTNDGKLRAYSADKGEKLLDVSLGRSGMGPPITYEVDGKQYIALVGGTGRAANIVGQTDAKVDFPPLLYVFELDGNASMPAPQPAFAGFGAPPPPPPTTH